MEKHNALGSDQHYQANFQTVYRKIEEDDPKTDNDLAHSNALKAINDAAGPNGLVQTLVGFGSILRLLIDTQNLQEHT